MALRITRHVLDGLIAHARDEAPFECCGLLAGDGEVIDEYVRTRNLRASEVAYEIDPRDHLAIIARAFATAAVRCSAPITHIPEGSHSIRDGCGGSALRARIPLCHRLARASRPTCARIASSGTR